MKENLKYYVRWFIAMATLTILFSQCEPIEIEHHEKDYCFKLIDGVTFEIDCYSGDKK